MVSRDLRGRQRKACGADLLAVAAIAAHLAATLAMIVELRIVYQGGALCFNPKQLSKMQKMRATQILL
jgi:hypothetical protein